ncbi:MAG: hypothetical protein QM757_00995 [Paludibaculum sp.]
MFDYLVSHAHAAAANRISSLQPSISLDTRPKAWSIGLMPKSLFVAVICLAAWTPYWCSAQAGAVIVTGPVRIQPQAAGNGDDVEVLFRNNSGKRIVAYVIFENFYSGDTLVDTVAHQYVSNDPSSRGYEPGTDWNQSVTIAHPPGKTATRLETTVDWVLFEDGAESGPNKSGWSVRVKAEMQGAYRERLRLKRILEQKGLAAVETELRNAGARPN